MRRTSLTEKPGRAGAVVARCALVVALVITAGGCAAGASSVAGSTSGKVSVHRSATVYVALAPEDAFEPAVTILLERDDIEITALDEAANRCTAVSGEVTITVRVIESTPGRSRLSVMVGRGTDADANQALADRLVGDLCLRLGVACEVNEDAP